MKNVTLILDLLKSSLSSKNELEWIENKYNYLNESFKASAYYLAFSSCTRYINASVPQIILEENNLKALSSVYPNFGKMGWMTDELVRVLLMCVVPIDQNKKILDQQFSTADYRETIALYKGLYLLENAAEFEYRVADGLRTNMSGIFDAICLYNPYSYQFLKEAAWNQTVLKAMFMERPMYKIFRIEARKNEQLAHIFLDYANERWSAKRKVSPELWRFISGFVDEVIFKDIQRLISSGDELEINAAIRATIESNYDPGIKWLEQQQLLIKDVPSWDEIGILYERAISNTSF